MKLEELRKVHLAQPFRPFTIHTADGKSLFVPHSEYLAYAPGSQTATVYSEDGTYSIVELLMITRIQVHHATPSGQAA
jgi:hypothetical protein